MSDAPSSERAMSENAMTGQLAASAGVRDSVDEKQAVSRLGIAALVVSGAGALVLAVWAYHKFIATPWLPLWDESFYYGTAAKIWRALRAGNIHAAGKETWHYHLALGMPFLAPYFLVLGLMVGGISLEAARTASLVAGVVSWAGIAWLAASLVEERKAYAAAIAGTLWASSPMFLFYSSRCLYDSFALVCTAFCFVGAARFARSGSRAAALATGILASMAFLTKYNVGALILAALFLGLAWPEIRKRLVAGPRAFFEQISRPWILLAATALAPVAAWWMFGEVRLFVTFLRGFPFDAMDLSTQLLFYPRAIFQDYVSVPALAVVILAGIVYWLLRGWGQPGVRVALLYVVLNLTGAELHTQKDGRFIWGSMAVAMALAGAFLAREIPRLPRRLGVVAGAAAAAAMAWSFWAAPAAAQGYFSRAQVAPDAQSDATLRAGLAFIRENTKPGQPVLLTGISDAGIHYGMVQEVLTDAVTGREPELELLPNVAQWLPSWGYSTQPSPRYAEELEKAFAQKPGATLVILNHEPGSKLTGRLYPWVLSWQENYARAAENLSDLEVVGRLDTHAGLRVTAYRRAGAESIHAH